MTEERRTDGETRGRLDYLHDDIKDIKTFIARVTDKFDDHSQDNHRQFSEVNSVVTRLASTVEMQQNSISELRETSKNQMETQTRLLNQFMVIESHKQHIDEIRNDIRDLRADINDVKQLETKMASYWKTLTVVAAIIAFAVSTGISIYSNVKPEAPTKTSSITKYIDRTVS